MNFNDLIDAEIKRQVEIQTAAYKAELQKDYENKLAEAKLFYKNLLKSKIERIFSEEELSLGKCNFPDCKNYRDGSVDAACEQCDNFKIKQEKNKKYDENLKDSASVKNIKEESQEESQEEEDWDSATDAEDAYAEMYGDHSSKNEQKSKEKDDFKSKVQSVIAASDKKYNKEESEQIVNDTIKFVAPFLAGFGISEEDIKAAREKMKDPEFREEAEAFAKKFGLNLL